MSLPANNTTVTLNLFQGPSSLRARMAQLEEWMLQQVQHDEKGGLSL